MIRAAASFFRETKDDNDMNLSDCFDPKEPEIVQVTLTNEKDETVPVYSIVCNEMALDELSYMQLLKIRNIADRLLDHDSKYLPDEKREERYN